MNYINSRRWKELRNYLFALLPQKVCARTGCPHEPKECHHLSYQNLGHETLEDVEFLCIDHHILADAEREKKERDAAEKRRKMRDERYLEAWKARWARKHLGENWKNNYQPDYVDAEFNKLLDRDE